ncbi:MAG: hypothetical protein ACLPVY_21585 [Acidimicrobiia bacterium]
MTARLLDHLPEPQRVSPPPAPPVVESSSTTRGQVVVCVISFGGACLMLYGNAQNSNRGAGPIASIVGTAIVSTFVALVLVAAAVHSVRDKAADRHLIRRFEVHCSTCETSLPEGYRREGETEALARVLKKHEDEAHPPYDPTIRKVLEVRIALVNAGTLALPTMIRRYRLTALSD